MLQAISLRERDTTGSMNDETSLYGLLTESTTSITHDVVEISKKRNDSLLLQTNIAASSNEGSPLKKEEKKQSTQ
jgi:hypothetical protein